MNENEFDYNNEEEAEMAQLHAMHINMNAIAAHRQEMEKRGGYYTHCGDCGEPIPVERAIAVKGCRIIS